MREKHAHGDRVVGVIRVAQWKVEQSGSVGVEREFAGIHQRHDSRCHERFRNRS